MNQMLSEFQNRAGVAAYGRRSCKCAPRFLST
jgi:hypothetical protein